jgi:hypothetical protein
VSGWILLPRVKRLVLTVSRRIVLPNIGRKSDSVCFGNILSGWIGFSYAMSTIEILSIWKHCTATVPNWITLPVIQHEFSTDLSRWILLSVRIIRHASPMSGWILLCDR